MIFRDEKSLVPGNKRTKTVRDVISTTKQGHKLRPKQSRGESHLPEKEVSDKSEEEAEDDLLHVG